VTELKDRLQSALGSAYVIERELGGGGMSRVFLAHETALGRHVVVKVLPPETAAGVNLERFRREIQLAASLQHPHIVPLLSAGASNDLLYYTMPLVEGESLRARLARVGELPIQEAVRIVREVVDALGYAHSRGVVHRDIKPDNILISGNHALVTDFGVAKAVSDATGDASLTSMGVALGTPAYMSPEQAAADPNVDHRADLYSVGVLAYEMLCGRAPFAGMAPQQVLAAHVTQAPDPISARRDTVPPALGELVMRCLEKKAADRPQRAEDMLAHLESMTTPAGMAPTGATGAVSAGTEGAIRRGHPARVAMLFGVASVVVLAVIYALVLKLGLPYWVLAGAVVLLAIGLPIMLVTGRREQQRAMAQTTGTHLPAPTGVERLFTWRRAVAGGVVAFSALAILAAAYTAMRLLGIGPVGTLVASGVLKERQPIILADFENHATDSALGPTLTEAFRVDLSQSPTVKLVDAQVIGDALKLMQRPPQTPVTPALAREVAQRQGIKAVVEGQIDPVGKGYVLSARVVSATTGDALAAVRQTADAESQLIPALDKLSKALRERIGESLVTIRADAPLARVTTGSLEALQKYTQAIRLTDNGREEEALPLLLQATTLDTGFAMAWRKLSVVYYNTNASNEKIVDASTRAFVHRDRLPEIERQLTAADYYQTVDYDQGKSIAAYRAALQIDSTNDPALNNLALVLMDQNRLSAAESLLVRGIKAGYGDVYFRNAIVCQVGQGHAAAADSTLATYARVSADTPGVLAITGGLANARGDYAAGARAWQRIHDAYPESQVWQERSNFNLAAISFTQGHLADGEKRASDGAAVGEARGLPQDVLTQSAYLAWIDLRVRGSGAKALARMDSALTKHPLSSLSANDRPYSQIAHFYADAGRPDEARRLLAEYEKAVPIGVRRADAQRLGAEGAVAQAEGRMLDAIAGYRAWRDHELCESCGLFELASAYQKVGQPDSAIAYYEKLVSSPWPRRILWDAQTLALSHQRLGELYEARGDRSKAVAAYTRLANLWSTADPELQPIVRDAKSRIARLSMEH